MTRTIVIGGILLSALVFCQRAAADEPALFKVEEDWRMQVQEPDAISCSPQVTFFMSPSADHASTYFQLQMNYFAAEGFSSGGFHVAAVHNGDIVDEARSYTRRPLSIDGDEIRWTSVMASIGDQLLFAVRDGQSEEWGEFGGPDYLVSMSDDDIELLHRYHHLQSVESVDIGFGANRVAGVELVAVRLYYTDGNVITLPVSP